VALYNEPEIETSVQCILVEHVTWTNLEKVASKRDTFGMSTLQSNKPIENCKSTVSMTNFYSEPSLL